MIILVIGQNPAKGREGELAFLDTRSGERLFRWLSEAGIELHRVHFVNLWPKEGKLPNSRELANNAHRIVRNYEWDCIFTVGNVAAKYVGRLLPINKWLPLPHPSGRNRQLNDKNLEKTIIEDIKYFLKGE